MVIREAKCPACLVEVVFMSNLKEELLLLDPAFRQKAAQGITTGIISVKTFLPQVATKP
jgi:N-acetylmuramoyl-L-alanine amidase